MPRGFLQVLSNAELDQVNADGSAISAKSDIPKDTSQLAGHIRRTFERMRRHRTSSGLDQRLLRAMWAYNGKYSPEKMRSILEFGGSDVYSRIGAIKCRGATSILRDVYMGFDRTWGIDPTPEPTLPDNIQGSVDALVGMEAMAMVQAGQPVDPMAMQERRDQLMAAARQAAQRKAVMEAKESETYIQDKLVEGGWNKAMRDFLIQLPIFPYACIKGPIVRREFDISWGSGPNGNVATIAPKARMKWYSPKPQNLYFTPGADDIMDSAVIERIKFSRADLNSVIGLPGYDEKAIRQVLTDYENGLVENLDGIDSAMADQQGKENPNQNDSELIDGLELHGPVKGSMLLELGFSTAQVPDPDLDYHVVAWLVGRYVIKAQINPDPKQRVAYFLTSFEKLPGALIGHSLLEIIDDVVSVANAALRSLVNNMSIASGPQVAINETRLAPSTNADTLYPWKRWRFLSDPLAVSGEKPVDFFQPQSNARELLGIYKEMVVIADETSGIPRFITGSEKGAGGAASTAAGLSMLMNNASKILQMIAGNIDEDVVGPAIHTAYDICMLTDMEGKLRGDENIVVRGVTLAQQKESERMRKLEFLQLTSNPIDLPIVGQKGRAALLRHLANDLGMRGEDIVPSQEEIAMMAQAQAAQPPQGPQGEALPEGAGRQGEVTDNQFRTRDMVPTPRGRPPGS